MLRSHHSHSISCPAPGFDIASRTCNTIFVLDHRSKKSAACPKKIRQASNIHARPKLVAPRATKHTPNHASPLSICHSHEASIANEAKETKAKQSTQYKDLHSHGPPRFLSHFPSSLPGYLPSLISTRIPSSLPQIYSDPLRSRT